MRIAFCRGVRSPTRIEHLRTSCRVGWPSGLSALATNPPTLLNIYFCLSGFQSSHLFIRDLWIQERGRLRVPDLTSSFFASSHYIDSLESFILPFFSRKVSTVTFSEGGYALSRWQKDKTTNI